MGKRFGKYELLLIKLFRGNFNHVFSVKYFINIFKNNIQKQEPQASPTCLFFFFFVWVVGIWTWASIFTKQALLPTEPFIYFAKCLVWYCVQQQNRKHAKCLPTAGLVTFLQIMINLLVISYPAAAHAVPALMQ